MMSKEEQESQIRQLKTENQKLQVRLKGYETVGKLAIEKQIEIKDLKTKYDELQRESEEKKRDKETQCPPMGLPGARGLKENRNYNDSTTKEALNDLQSLAPRRGSTPSGSSSSFSVIGKSSQDSHLALNSSSPISFPILNSNVNMYPREQQYGLAQTRNIDMSASHEGIQVGNIQSRENRLKSISTSSTKQGEQKLSHLNDNLGEFIQVFPEGSQSSVSNFDTSSMDQEQGGGQSCVNSSRKGLMSLINLSSNETSLTKVGSEAKKENCKDPDIVETGYDTTTVWSSPVILPGPLHPSSYNGIGARPKEIVPPSAHTTPIAKLETCKLETSADPLQQENKEIMVKIPDSSEQFRVNNAPYLPFGRNQSQTEANNLLSFGSTLSPATPEKVTAEQELFNRSIMVQEQDSQHSAQTIYMSQMEKQTLLSQAPTLKNLLLSKRDFETIKSIMIPFIEEAVLVEKKLREVEVENDQLRLLIKQLPVSFGPERKQPTEEDSRMQDDQKAVSSQNNIETELQAESTIKGLTESKKILEAENEHLRIKSNKLQMANKEWKDRWEVLKKQQEGENSQLRLNVKQLTEVNDKMKWEKENVISSLREKLLHANSSKKELERAYFVLNGGREQEKLLLDKLKQDYGNLHQEKHTLEIQLETLKGSRPEKSRTTEFSEGTFELENELGVVKSQLTLFMEDFNKEHEERLAVENKLQKEKDTNKSLENKLKNAHNMLKARDEDLRKKSKQVSDLQFQLEDLKLKLEIEQRRASIYPSIDVPSAVIAQEHGQQALNPRPKTIVPSQAPAKQKTAVMSGLVKTPGSFLQTARLQEWVCPMCTYRNSMHFNKCEVCLNAYKGPEIRSVELEYIEDN